MSIGRRKFLQRLGTISGAATVAGIPLTKAFAGEMEELTRLYFDAPGKDAGDEDFWGWVQQSYTVSPNIINLNNGGVSPQPKVVQEAFERYNRLSNEGPSYYMWRILDQGREALRYDLSLLAGCSPEEIAIDRNTTEAMNTVIYGLDLKPGDEVVLTRQDYPNVINAWKLREQRDGIVLRWVNLELPGEDDQKLAEAYTELFNERTRVVNVTHIINWIGQIIPVRKIAEEAHKRDIDVLVDGAHSFALLDFKIPDLDCDYFATSLHKWLSAPFGTGLLYVRQEKIPGVWALSPDETPRSADIRKFERLGTRSFPTEMAIGSALDFHNLIGSRRKEQRLRFLKDYWMEEVRKLPRVKIHTSLKPEFSCLIGLFSIDGLKPGDIDSYLFNEHKIHTVGIEWANISGVRVTPSTYTRLGDLDKLIDAITELSEK